jgi:uncharacterized protein (TIGR02594 family)
MTITAYDLAERFLGLQEADGTASNPAILAMLRLDAAWVEDDETPWCSAFVNQIAWLLRLPRSRSLAARSWLAVGRAIPLEAARPGWDVVILQRGTGRQPGPEVLDAPGHVGFFAGQDHSASLRVLGGNQGNAVTIDAFPVARVLGVRRLFGGLSG